MNELYFKGETVVITNVSQLIDIILREYIYNNLEYTVIAFMGVFMIFALLFSITNGRNMSNRPLFILGYALLGLIAPHFCEGIPFFVGKIAEIQSVIIGVSMFMFIFTAPITFPIIIIKLIYDNYKEKRIEKKKNERLKDNYFYNKFLDVR